MCMFCSLEHDINVASCEYNMHTTFICAALCVHLYTTLVCSIGTYIIVSRIGTYCIKVISSA